MKNSLVHQIENYVQETFSKAAPDDKLTIAHDYKHVHRVRNWALRIAQGEDYADVLTVELAALLHDIGLPYLDKNEKRNKHGEIGAEIAFKYLMEKSNLTEKQVNNITAAIKYHCVSPSQVEEQLSRLGDNGKLLEILRDADNLDAFGAVGLMREFISHYYLPDYNPSNIKGDAWALSPVEFRHKFGISPKEGHAPVNYNIDQINQQISYYDNLHTGTAKRLALPLVDFMKNFVLQIEQEINFDKTLPQGE